MTANDSGRTPPHHTAPIERECFFHIRQTGDPDQSYVKVCRILTERDLREHPSHTLARCSDLIDGHGVESVSLATGDELAYVNKGDTYDATLCYTEERGYFVSSWGDVAEESERKHEEDTGERRCCHCSEWTRHGAPCGCCGGLEQ